MAQNSKIFNESGYNNASGNSKCAVENWNDYSEIVSAIWWGWFSNDVAKDFSFMNKY